MKVKRFFAPDMRQAMRRVREEIGSDAVILSNHRVAGGVEVVAAHENDYEAAQETFSSKAAPARDLRKQSQVDLLTRGQSGRLPSELYKARAQIAEAQENVSRQQFDEGAGRNRQLAADDEEDLRSILMTLKTRQKERADDAHRSFMQHDEPSFSDPLDDLPDPYQQQEPVRSVAPPSPQPSAEDIRSEQIIRTMQGEIEQLKAMLEQRPTPEAPAPAPVVSSPQPRKSPIQRKLELIGVSDRLANQLLSGVERGLSADKVWKNTLARLSDSIPVEGEDYIERGGMVAFVGPTGVGKTTTIGKLAARYVLKYGSSSLALVTTDTFRIAAHEQLRTFGRILDVPVRVVDENHSLEEVLQSLKNKRLVLIDTAGLNAQEPYSETQLQMLEEVTLRLKKLLVISCSSQRSAVEQAFSAYRDLGLDGCVLSKMDESGNLGEALSMVIERRLPVTYVTDGQKIPDDIEIAKKHELVSRAVVTAQRAIETERRSAELDSISKTG